MGSMTSRGWTPARPVPVQSPTGPVIESQPACATASTTAKVVGVHRFGHGSSTARKRSPPCWFQQLVSARHCAIRVARRPRSRSASRPPMRGLGAPSSSSRPARHRAEAPLHRSSTDLPAHGLRTETGRSVPPCLPPRHHLERTHGGDMTTKAMKPLEDLTEQSALREPTTAWPAESRRARGHRHARHSCMRAGANRGPRAEIRSTITSLRLQIEAKVFARRNAESARGARQEPPSKQRRWDAHWRDEADERRDACRSAPTSSPTSCAFGRPQLAVKHLDPAPRRRAGRVP